MQEEEIKSNNQCCEGCNETYEDVETFFRHVSHAKKCKAIYGERFEKMRDERKKEVGRKKVQKFRSLQHETNLKDEEEACETDGGSLNDLIDDGYMIKCEGCNQILQTDTFFKHASHAQKCKAVYGERLEIMKTEKRKKVQQISFEKNHEKNKEKQQDYYVKNKASVRKKRSSTFQENSIKEDIIKKEKMLNTALRENNDRLESKIGKLINAWKQCRGMDVKEFTKKYDTVKDADICSKILSMKEKVDKTVKQFQNKLKNSEVEWQLRDRKKYNLVLEELIEEWMMYARKVDHSFKELEKASGKKLTCYQCIVTGSNCYPKCKNGFDDEKLKPYEFEFP